MLLVSIVYSGNPYLPYIGGSMGEWGAIKMASHYLEGHVLLPGLTLVNTVLLMFYLSFMCYVTPVHHAVN